MSRDPHRTAELRSLAYHRVIAERLERQPELLELVARRLGERARQGAGGHYARQWQRLVAGPRERLVEVMVSDDADARALRQSTPFAGVLSARERWRIWRESC